MFRSASSKIFRYFSKSFFPFEFFAMINLMTENEGVSIVEKSLGAVKTRHHSVTIEFNNYVHSIANVSLMSDHKFADNLRRANKRESRCPDSPLMNDGRRNVEHLITPLFSIATSAR